MLYVNVIFPLSSQSSMWMFITGFPTKNSVNIPCLHYLKTLVQPLDGRPLMPSICHYLINISALNFYNRKPFLLPETMLWWHGTHLWVLTFGGGAKDLKFAEVYSELSKRHLNSSILSDIIPRNPLKVNQYFLRNLSPPSSQSKNKPSKKPACSRY